MSNFVYLGILIYRVNFAKACFDKMESSGFQLPLELDLLANQFFFFFGCLFLFFVSACIHLD